MISLTRPHITKQGRTAGPDSHGSAVPGRPKRARSKRHPTRAVEGRVPERVDLAGEDRGRAPVAHDVVLDRY
jgi:hypothetical protein